jgi:hypothetical protein
MTTAYRGANLVAGGSNIRHDPLGRVRRRLLREQHDHGTPPRVGAHDGDIVCIDVNGVPADAIGRKVMRSVETTR